MKDLVSESNIFTHEHNQTNLSEPCLFESLQFSLKGEKVKVNMLILDLAKYSFVVRSKDLCHTYVVPLRHKIWDKHSFEC